MSGIINRDSVIDEAVREEIILSISQKYKFANCAVLAKSTCNRNIHSIQIGTPKNQAIFVGAFHGMEWLTSLLLLCFVDKICWCMKNSKPIKGVDISTFLEKSGLFVIPCINPDGVEISLHGAESAGVYKNLVTGISPITTNRWQANARGVDLNHNFDAGWQDLHTREQKEGITTPCTTRFGGTKPESEKETKALVDICVAEKFRHALAFHSQGEEIYWRYGENVPENSKIMAYTLAKSSRYTLADPEGLAMGGGFKDWFIDKFNKPAFTVEIGKGENPLLTKEISAIYEKLEKMLVFATIM